MDLSSNKKFILLVSGYKGSGKDVIAKFMCDNYGFKRFAFADRLKDITSNNYNTDRFSFDDEKQKEQAILNQPVIAKDIFAKQVQLMIFTHFRTECGVAPGKEELPTHTEDGNLLYLGNQLYWTRRALMVLEGSTKRTTNPNYWVDIIKEMCEQPRIVISDWRYPNEIQRITELFKHHHDYEIINVRIDVGKQSNDVDESERKLDDYSFQHRIFNKHDGIEKFLDDVYKTLIR